MMAPSNLSSHHPLFALENIYRAYRKCRRRKRGTVNAMLFEQNLEENLVQLREELTSGTYRPGSSLAFLVDKPKRREIFAAEFRDRVVHHLLVDHLEQGWEKRFIYDSHACRKGKGTHKGVDRLQSFTRKATANDSRQAWYLQLDIRGYFVSINRTILYQRLAAKEKDPVVLWLIQAILFKSPTEGCRFRASRQSDFLRLPAHKTLFKAKHDCGLPIGNLTSQFFANVYLDALDQFIKHDLKVKYYVRYCDDIVLLSATRDKLQGWKKTIEQFINDRLELRLNPKQKLRPVSDGIDFLGYIIRPDYLLVRRRVIGNLYERLKQVEKTLQQHGLKQSADGRVTFFPWPQKIIARAGQRFNSYLGHFGKAASFRLVQRIRQQFDWLDEYYKWHGNKVIQRFPNPLHATLYSRQKSWFIRHLPGHQLFIQKGGYWETAPGGLGHDKECAERSMNTPWPKSLIPHRLLKRLQPFLWQCGQPVAFIGETSRRHSAIAERALVFRLGYSMKIE